MNKIGLECHKRTLPLSGFRNGQRNFEVPAGLRVETDYEGNVRKIAELAPTKVSGTLLVGNNVIENFSPPPTRFTPSKAASSSSKQALDFTHDPKMPFEQQMTRFYTDKCKDCRGDYASHLLNRQAVGTTASTRGANALTPRLGLANTGGTGVSPVNGVRYFHAKVSLQTGGTPVLPEQILSIRAILNKLVQPRHISAHFHLRKSCQSTV